MRKKMFFLNYIVTNCKEIELDFVNFEMSGVAEAKLRPYSSIKAGGYYYKISVIFDIDNY